MARYVLEVMYDGTCFHGSQIQGDTPTVQLSVNNTLSTLLRKPILSFGASRTDEGVHALSNFYHFDHDDELRPDFLYKCNAIMPSSVCVKKVYRANDPEFNVRFAAVVRSYRYRIYAAKDPFLVNRALFYPFPICEDTLHQTAAAIREYDQFESFAKRNAQSKTMFCTIYQSRWERVGQELHYVVAANRFLRGMVRGLVGTQLHIARGSKDVAAFRSIVEAQNCTKAFFNVPGHGLYLEKVEYPENAMTDLLSR
jgi:tRNA pseudouridine38-40 synthase